MPGHAKMSKRNPRNVPAQADLRSRRGGQADDTRWLNEAAVSALTSLGTDRAARAAFALAPKVAGIVNPVLKGGGRGSVHVPASVAADADAEALRMYGALLDGRRFASLPHAERKAIAAKTGWQETPVGETVRKLPEMDLGPGWRRYEPYATDARAVMSGVGEEFAAHVPPMRLEEAVSGPGADQLFLRMPDARNWLVRAAPAESDAVMGYTEAGSRGVTLTDAAIARGAPQVADTLRHETQHVIQNATGMSPGSTSADAYGALKAGVRNAMIDGRGADPAVVRAADALGAADRAIDPAYFAYRHTGGEAGAFAAGSGERHVLITDDMSGAGIVPEYVYDPRAFAQDARGGQSAPDPRGGSSSADRSARSGGEAPRDRFSMSRNFLATDKVPETIFGIPVVSRKEDYTEADLQFFREHPEAGGYYDLGEETPEDGSPEGAPVQADEAGEFMARNPTLFSHVKAFEKMSSAPYKDVGGYAIGYGAHTAEDGSPVTEHTKPVDAGTAERMLARDLYARREKLASTIPSWSRIPGAGRQALLDVAMGRDGILSPEKSPGLHKDLAAAGGNPERLLAAVKKHYTTYRKSSRPEDRAGLEARRIAGMKTFFGEDYVYAD